MQSNGQRRGFAWAIDPRTPVATVTFSGECDLLADPAMSEVEESVPLGATALLLDLTALSFIDSTGLRRLMLLKRALEQRGVRLFLTKVSATAQRVFDAAGVSSFFEYAYGRRRTWRAVFRDTRVRKKNGLVTP